MSADRSRRLEALRQTLELLPESIARVGVDGHDARRRPEDWSLREVVAHLADAETVYGVRLRLLVATDDPVLQGYDEEAWTRRFGPLETVESALDRWRSLREANLRLLDSLTEAEWRRTGRHSERGVESVEDQLVRMEEHDVGHLRQLADLATAL